MNALVAFLKSRTCVIVPAEVEAGHVDRLPAGRLRREAVVDGELRAGVVVEDVGVEAEAGADDHAVVADLLDDLVDPGEGVLDVVAVGVLADLADVAVEDRVLQLELVHVEDARVVRAEVPDEVRAPGQFHRPRAADVHDRGRLDQVVRRLEGGVPLAQHQDPLVLELLRVDGDVGVLVGELDPGDVRGVRLADAGGHDQPSRAELGVTGGDHEDLAVPPDARHARVVPDVDLVLRRVVGEVAEQILGDREELLAVVGEEHRFVVAVGEDRVPVHPEVQLRVGPAGVLLVDRDERPVPRVGAEERAGRGPALQHEVPPRLWPRNCPSCNPAGPAPTTR